MTLQILQTEKEPLWPWIFNPFAEGDQANTRIYSNNLERAKEFQFSLIIPFQTKKKKEKKEGKPQALGGMEHPRSEPPVLQQPGAWNKLHSAWTVLLLSTPDHNILKEITYIPCIHVNLPLLQLVLMDHII